MVFERVWNFYHFKFSLLGETHESDASRMITLVVQHVSVSKPLRNT